VFSILFIISLVLIRISVPATPGDAGTWLSPSVKSIRLALDLLPFARIAFPLVYRRDARPHGGKRRPLLRHRVRRQRAPVSRDDFTYSAVLGGLITAYAAIPGKLIDSGIYTFARTVAYLITGVYALRMAAVFMISTSTLSIRIAMFPAGWHSSATCWRFGCSSEAGVSPGIRWFFRCGCS
jgi:hypothetical protein